MSDQHSLTTFERPHCTRCQAKMLLEHVAPGPIGYESRLFECPKCSQAETRVIATDQPLNSGNLGSFSSAIGTRPAITHSIKNGKMIPRPAD